MARARQDWLQVAPALLALGSALALPGALAATVATGPTPAPAQFLAQGQPGPAQGQRLYDDTVPRKGSSCPLLVPSQVSFLQPKRLKPEQVKAKNAAGCLSPADAIYGPDGCPLRLCPNPQWQGL